MHRLRRFAGVPLKERDHPKLAGGAIPPALLAKFGGELSDLLPVAERGLHIPLKVDVAFGGQRAQAKTAVANDDRARKVASELVGQVSEGVNLHLAAQPSELRIEQLGWSAGRSCPRLCRQVDRPRGRPICQPGETISFF